MDWVKLTSLIGWKAIYEEIEVIEKNETCDLIEKLNGEVIRRNECMK